MKTYFDIHTEMRLPKWYTSTVHIDLVAILTTKDKLQACKYLLTFNIGLSDKLYLHEAKAICDAITAEPVLVEPTYTKDQVKEFMRLAFEKGCNYESENSIAEHTSSIGYQNPYYGMDGSEVLDELIEETFPKA